MDRVDEVLALLRQDNSLSVAREHSSVFKDTLRKLLPENDASASAAGEEIIAALEILISRQMTDSQRIISACVALSQITGLPIAKVIKKVELATGHLKLPSPSWVAKNIRAAKVVATHPGLADIEDVEKIASLKRLPEEKLKEASETGTIDVAGRQVDIKRASRKEVGKAVKEVVDADKPPKNESIDKEDAAETLTAEHREVAAAPERAGASADGELTPLKESIQSALETLPVDDEAYAALRSYLHDSLLEIARLDGPRFSRQAPVGEVEAEA